MASKKQETPKNFKVDPEFDCWMSRLVTDLNCTLTDFVLASIVIAAPQIKSRPSILKTYLAALEEMQNQELIDSLRRQVERSQ